MDIVRFIEEKKPFIFAKFGDGEYYATIQTVGGNGDGTPFTPRLKEAVIDAFKYLTQFPNVYIGKWEGCGGVPAPHVPAFFQSITPYPVNWANYNILIARNAHEMLTRTVPYFKAIRNSSCQKIYVCNETMVELSRSLLKIDDFAIVHPTNWFELTFQETVNNIVSSVKDPNNVIIMSSCGMGAKPLIAALHKHLPNATMLDVGSALDLVCSGRRTRDFHILSDAEIQEIHNALIA